jgi:hypothetical protein
MLKALGIYNDILFQLPELVHVILKLINSMQPTTYDT